MDDRRMGVHDEHSIENILESHYGQATAREECGKTGGPWRAASSRGWTSRDEGSTTLRGCQNGSAGGSNDGQPEGAHEMLNRMDHSEEHRGRMDGSVGAHDGMGVSMECLDDHHSRHPPIPGPLDGHHDAHSGHHYDHSSDPSESSSRSTIYDDMLKIYVDRSKSREENPRKNPMVWLSLLILASNPLVGIYLLYHFHNWPEWVAQNGSLWNAHYAHHDGHSTHLTILGRLWSILGGSSLSRLVTIPPDGELPFAAFIQTFARMVRKYAFVEVFGEICFALFSLVFILLCRLPCNSKRYRIQSILPSIAMLYMVIYKILALYILTNGVRLLLWYLVVLIPWPEWVLHGPEWRGPLWILDGYPFWPVPIHPDTIKAFRELWKMDVRGHFWLIIFCAENVYITVMDTVELIYTLARMTARGMRRLIAKLKRQQESLYYTLAPGDSDYATCGSCYILMSGPMDGSDPHEKYIHSMYNDRTDVGTYLKNVDAKEYGRGLENFAAKLLKQGQA